MRTAWPVILAAAAACVAPAAPAWACPPVSHAKAAFDARNLAAADAVANAARATCAQRPPRTAIRRLAALTYLEVARAAVLSDPQKADDLLRMAERHYPHWRVMLEIGWRARANRQFEEAGRALAVAAEDAMHSVNAPLVDADPPPNAHNRALIVALLDETQLVLGRVMTTASRAACEMSNNADFTVTRAAPVTFEFGTATPTSHGEEAIDVLFSCLSRLRGVAEIAVLGHTDQIGSDTYNCELSLERAHVIANTLNGRGLRVAVRVAGLGKRAPFNPAPGTQYNQNQINQMNRRVEVDVPPRGRRLSMQGRPVCQQ